MFFNDNYAKLLKGMCSLTRLYSESEIPYLSYRISENIFCRSFNANNLARKDSSFDARKNAQGKVFGIGLKTFQMKGNHSLEKIAEFNAISERLREYSGKKLAIKVSEARNERINTAKNLYAPDNILYHCVGRRKRSLSIFESSYDPVSIDKVKMLNSNSGNILKFKDSINEYSYNISKSTLYKRFHEGNKPREISIKILENPFQIL